MEKHELFTIIKDVLAVVIRNPEVKNVSHDTKLKDEIGLDSMTSLMFLLALEDKLKFSVDPATLKVSDFYSIETICNYVENQIKS